MKISVNLAQLTQFNSTLRVKCNEYVECANKQNTYVEEARDYLSRLFVDAAGASQKLESFTAEVFTQVTTIDAHIADLERQKIARAQSLFSSNVASMDFSDNAGLAQTQRTALQNQANSSAAGEFDPIIARLREKRANLVGLINGEVVKAKEKVVKTHAPISEIGASIDALGNFNMGHAAIALRLGAAHSTLTRYASSVGTNEAAAIADFSSMFPTASSAWPMTNILYGRGFNQQMQELNALSKELDGTGLQLPADPIARRRMLLSLVYDAPIDGSYRLPPGMSPTGPYSHVQRGQIIEYNLGKVDPNGDFDGDGYRNSIDQRPGTFDLFPPIGSVDLNARPLPGNFGVPFAPGATSPSAGSAPVPGGLNWASPTTVADSFAQDAVMPDADGDGIPDSIDRTPTGGTAPTPRPVAPMPDADGDGIPDSIDRTPTGGSAPTPRPTTTTSTTTTMPLPDYDGDGIPDILDANDGYEPPTFDHPVIGDLNPTLGGRYGTSEGN
jgi:hypothetical protein